MFVVDNGNKLGASCLTFLVSQKRTQVSDPGASKKSLEVIMTRYNSAVSFYFYI